jgi:hypothetical protein
MGLITPHFSLRRTATFASVASDFILTAPIYAPPSQLTVSADIYLHDC